MTLHHPSLPQRLLGLVNSCLGFALGQLERSGVGGVSGLLPAMARLRRLAELLGQFER